MQSDLEGAEEQEEAENGSNNNLSQTGDDAQIEEQPSEPVHTVRSILEVKFPNQHQISIANSAAPLQPYENLFLVDWNCPCC